MGKQDIRELYAKVKALSDDELAHAGAGVVMVTGHQISHKNAALARMQSPSCTKLGGFHQWLDAGRCVNKGESSIIIRGFSTKQDEEGGEKAYFPRVNVFDVSQTRELTEEEKAKPRKERKENRSEEHKESTTNERSHGSGAVKAISTSLLETAKRRADAARIEISRPRVTNTWRRANIAKGCIADAERELTKANAIIRLSGDSSLWDAVNFTVSKFDDARKLIDLPEFKGCEEKSTASKAVEARQNARGAGVDFFPTLPDLALRMAEMANISATDEVLEPSCGFGALIKAAHFVCPSVSVHGLELSRSVCEVATIECEGAYIDNLDFIEWDGGDHYDVVLMNPPFSNDQAHIVKAWGHLAKGGRLVAIAGEGAFTTKDKNGAFSLWLNGIGAEVERLDGKNFEGTGANARLIFATKGDAVNFRLKGMK